MEGIKAGKANAAAIMWTLFSQRHIKPAEDIHHIDSFMNYTGTKRLAKAFDFNNLCLSVKSATLKSTIRVINVSKLF